MCRIPHLISSHSHTYLANFWSLSDSFSSNSDSSSHSLSSSAFTISSSGWGTLPGSGGAPTKLCRTSHWCVLHHYHNYYYLVLSKQKQNWAVSSQWVWLFDTFFGFGAVGGGGMVAFGIARSAECVGGGVVGDQIDAFRRRSSSSSFIIPSEYSSILQLRTGRATRKRLMIPNETLAQSGMKL